jgi:peptidyl-prolyl cis-trans isomerase SurA
MKKALSLCLLFLSSTLFCLTSYAKTSEQSLDQIVAIINDDVITKSELNHAISTTKMQLEQAQTATPPEDIFHKQVMDQLINRKLQLQMAKQSGIQIPDAELENTISRIAKQNNMSISMLYDRLTKEGMSIDEYRSEMRDQMTLQKLQQQEVVGKISVSPQEITNFMHSKIWQTNGQKEYHLEDILVPLSDTPSSQEVVATKKQAEAVIVKLNQGQSLRDVAKAESRNKLESNDLGWRKLPEIPSAFGDQVARMQTKEIAGPIQTSNGFHIIRLVAARNIGTQAAPDRKQVEELLLQRKFEEAVQNWVSKLRNQAFIVMDPEKSKA